MSKINYSNDALEYIAKIAEGGMRDAITLMDKCLSFSNDLTLENVVKALGTVDYDVMKDLTNSLLQRDTLKAVEIVENVYMSGKDIKQFVNLYVRFLIDVQKFAVGCDFKYIQLPALEDNKKWLNGLKDEDFDILYEALRKMIKLNSDIKWSQTPKYDLEAILMLLCMED